MVGLSFEGHTTVEAVFSASGDVANGGFIVEELAEIYHGNLPDPRLDLLVVTGDTRSNGQYFSWLYHEADYESSPDYTSRRSIQALFMEWPVYEDYGCLEEGKIGKYACDDESDGVHISSTDLVEWLKDTYVEMAKYLIKQSETPFAPLYYDDLTCRPECPEADLALVGAKISKVGSGKKGCLSVDSQGWDILSHGEKQITFNVQNNGTSSANVGAKLTLCNRTDDPTCQSPQETSFSKDAVPSYGMETFTHTEAFEKDKEYVLTIETDEEASSLDNDLKRYVFRTVADLFGTVKDAATEEPLGRALVLVQGKGLRRLALTDDNGFFEIDRLRREGNYRISVWKRGYTPVLRGSLSFDGSPVEYDVDLSK